MGAYMRGSILSPGMILFHRGATVKPFLSGTKYSKKNVRTNQSVLLPSIHSKRDIEGAVVRDQDLVLVPGDGGRWVASSDALQGHCRQPTDTTHPTAVLPYHRWSDGCNDRRERDLFVG